MSTYLNTLQNASVLNATDTDYVLDKDWAKSAFLISDNDFQDPDDVKKRYWSSASVKFTDTTIGGNIGINAKPQFTRYSDIRVKGRVRGRRDVSLDNHNGGHGMGRYYSEAIDDNSQTIYMRFGHPQFNSLTNFMSRAFEPNAASIASTGRALGSFYNAGQLVGTIAFVTAFPALSLSLFAGSLFNMYLGRNVSKFYSLKPDMHNYWGAVNSLINNIAVNSGILPRKYMDKTQDQTPGKLFKIDDNFLQNLHSLMPDVFSETYGLDMYKVATKAQRMSTYLHKKDHDALNRGVISDYEYFIKKTGNEKINQPPGSTPSLLDFINKFVNIGYWVNDDDDEKTASNLASSPKVDPKTGKDVLVHPDKSGFWDYVSAMQSDGAEFAVFKVNNTGPVSESFSNDVGESELQSKFNSMSSSSRDVRFSLAGGNISDGFVGKLVGSIGIAMKDFATGLAEGGSFGLSNVLLGLVGAGKIDIPKQWQDSTAKLPTVNYTMDLVAPYNNVISRLQNIFMPLSMLLAGTLPLSTGKQSFTSPFLCQIYDKGKCQIQLGIIDSLNITRGEGNLGFDNAGNVLSVKVSFSVVDLSTIMHMPISSGISIANALSTDEDSVLYDYLAVLAGLDIHSQFYFKPRTILKMAKTVRRLETLSSPAFYASMFHKTTTTTNLGVILTGGTQVWASARAASSSVLSRN